MAWYDGSFFSRDVIISPAIFVLFVSMSSFVGLVGNGRVLECRIGLIVEVKLGYTIFILDI